MTALPKRGAAQAAADRLRTRILRGEVRAGNDLPPERELAAELGVSRLTLRSALARLETEGLVRSVHGSGTRVLDFRRTGGVDLIADLLRVATSGPGAPPVDLFRDLLELRRVVAVEVLGLVAERATERDVASIRAQLVTLGSATTEPRAFMEADLELARRFVASAHNLAIELLANTVLRTLEDSEGLLFAFAANAEQTVTVYERLVSLIEARDGVRVRRSADRLIDRLDRHMLDRMGIARSPSSAGASASAQTEGPR